MRFGEGAAFRGGFKGWVGLAVCRGGFIGDPLGFGEGAAM